MEKIMKQRILFTKVFENGSSSFKGYRENEIYYHARRLTIEPKKWDYGVYFHFLVEDIPGCSDNPIKKMGEDVIYDDPLQQQKKFQLIPTSEQATLMKALGHGMIIGVFACETVINLFHSFMKDEKFFIREFFPWMIEE